ncbi:hypothetical protein [Jiangella rhizosphaerae]|uniref:hypothetical protein n=1 Tax=Jiangella rhizosphaerae TaxID=2293569 RepID=UPI0011C3F126|nr:hypothetical protein [Jiangella rhizosphaerae]
MRSSQVVLGRLLTGVVVAFYRVASRGTPVLIATTMLAGGHLAALIRLRPWSTGSNSLSSAL